MALPQTRDQFKDYILRRLGAPVIQVNVDDLQVEDRIDDPLAMFTQYHYDGTQQVYLAHQVTSQDKTNTYVTLDPSIVGITRMLALSTSIGSTSIFSLNYQFAQSDLLQSAMSASSVVPLWMALSRLEFMQQVLVGTSPVRYNVHMGKVFIDMDWTRVATGDYIMLEGYSSVDPVTYPGIWSDRWLLRYATALVKRMMGENIKKFGNMQMAGGITFNGQKVWEEAVAEIEELEKQVMNELSGPCQLMIG